LHNSANSMGILQKPLTVATPVAADSHVYLSAIDEERFGFRTARAQDLTASALPGVLAACHASGVTLCIARCGVADIRAAQAMEQAGFALMDTLVYYARNLTTVPLPSDAGGLQVRPVRPGEEERVKAVAARSFGGYCGHYHADEQLDRAAVDEIYPSWAWRSCVSRDVADEVLVADLDGTILGFATLRLNSPEEGEGVLFGVAPFAQGRGIYRSFMIHGMRWCQAKGVSRMVVSTQLTNVAVQKVWTRVGFEFSHAHYTFHKWFHTQTARD